MLILLVSLSVLGLFAGALLPAIGRVRADAEGALTGLALGMLPALVLARLLPHTFESLGAWALVLAAVGFGLVTLSHHAGERAEARLGSALVLPALLLHAVGDGATLAMSSSGRVGGAGTLLAAAAILHRVPEGLFVASNRKDVRGALTAALPLALATLAGALMGQGLFEALPDSALDGVLALGAGAMLRMLSHTHEQGDAHEPRGAAHALAAIGFLVGLGVVLAVPGPHDFLRSAQPRELSVAVSLWPLFVESAPALLAGLLLTAALRTWRGQWRGVEAGPLGFRWLGAGVFGAWVVGAVALSWLRRESAHAHGAGRRFALALKELLERDGAPFCLGLLAAAALEAALAPGWLAAVEAPWDLLLAAAAAGLCPMSALAAIPLAAVLVHKGASIGAALVFLWLSPLLQAALWSGGRRGLRQAVGAVGIALGLGFAASAGLSTRGMPEVHPLLAHAHAPWEIACALLLGAALLSSLVRLGPRGFAAGLWEAPSPKPHAHTHGTSHHQHAVEAH